MALAFDSHWGTVGGGGTGFPGLPSSSESEPITIAPRLTINGPCELNTGLLSVEDAPTFESGVPGTDTGSAVEEKVLTIFTYLILENLQVSVFN